MPTPYAQYVGNRDPVDVLQESLEEYRQSIAPFSSDTWRAPWAPGKWTMRQIVVHVTQWELIFCVRLRCALAVPDYEVQPFEQDPFMAEADAVDGPTAFAAFDAMRRMNLAFARSLTAADRARGVDHPERGRIDVNDLLVTLAGHPVHHLQQIKQFMTSQA